MRSDDPAPDHGRVGLDEIAWLREISIDKDDTEPLYQQLYTQIRRQIVTDRRFGQGAHLPSSRWLAAHLGISRNTVVLAYQRLQEDGYVRGMAGGGTVVHMATSGAATSGQPRGGRPPGSARPAAHRNHREAAGAGMRGAAFPVGVPPVDLFPAALWANLTGRRLRLSGERVLLDANPVGYQPLREAVAAYLGVLRGIRCGPEQVIITHGADSGLDVLVRALLTPGDRVCCEEPGWPAARAVLARNGCRPYPVPVDADGVDPAAAARVPDARMAVVSAARQLPLAVPLSPARRHRLLEHVRANDMWLVEHETDAAFLRPDTPAPLSASDPTGRVIYLGTFNTVLFPQLRVGFCVLPGTLVEPVSTVLAEVGGEVSGLAQQVLADFLDHHRFARFLRRIRAAGSRRRRLVTDALARLPDVDLRLPGRPDDGSYLTAIFATPVDEALLIEQARRAGLRVAPLARYYAGQPDARGFLLGCAGVKEEAIGPAMRLLAPLISRRVHQA